MTLIQGRFSAILLVVAAVEMIDPSADNCCSVVIVAAVAAAEPGTMSFIPPIFPFSVTTHCIQPSVATAVVF